MFRAMIGLCGFTTLWLNGWCVLQPLFKAGGSETVWGDPRGEQPRPDAMPSGTLPIAPPPRAYGTYFGPKERLRGVVTAASWDTLALKEIRTGTVQEFHCGPWLGSKCLPKGFKYHFRDVRIGDHVGLGYDIVDGVKLVQEMSLDRRPDGKIPPEPRTDPNDPLASHRIRQMYQDNEEKGVPLPDGYSDESRAEMRKLARTIEQLKKLGWNPLAPAQPPPPPMAPPPKLIDN